MTPSDPVFSTGVTLGRSGSLVERSLATLAGGPMSTARIAEEILALRGNPKVAAAAVFALLGSDPRFTVDTTGTWRLASGGAELPTVSFADQEWVVVDVETTGGSPAHGHRIIEIAAVRVAGGEIVGEYTTLVNPRRSIPMMITSLTGINDAAVAGAPHFEEIAPLLMDALHGRAFVGHNASFDWRFVRAEVERCTGRTLIGRQFCTLRVARRLLPGLSSRSLGALADYFGIDMAVRHRARDDAIATAALLLRFLEALADRGVEDWSSFEAFFSAPRRPPRRRTAHPISLDKA